MIIFIVTPSRFISENPFFHLSVANISIFSGYAILCRGNNDIVGKVKIMLLKIIVGKILKIFLYF